MPGRKLLLLTVCCLPITIHAWTIGSKLNTTGPSIHITYFLTPNNAKVLVKAEAYLGLYLSGTCAYSSRYDIGEEEIKTGDYIKIDAFALKALIGNGYNCMSMFYTYKQRIIETFLLIFDQGNYITTYPNFQQINIATLYNTSYNASLLT